MIVTELRPVDKKRTQVQVEGQSAVVLYNGELARYHIREGEELPLPIWEEITKELLVKRSRKRALHLLMKSDKTRNQLLQKLQSDGYPFQIAEQAVAYAESYGYIDDARYTRRYLEGPGAKKSRTAARLDLLRKGISPELIDKILQETLTDPQETERVKASQLAEKRLGPPRRLDEKEYRRAYNYLARRGFSHSDVCFALSKYKNPDDEH